MDNMEVNTDKEQADSTSHSQDDFGSTVFRNFFDLFFRPEIERRIASGVAAPPMTIVMAQALFPSGRSPIVRLNDEVRGRALVKASPAIAAGDAVAQSDLQYVEKFDLVDEELDCGHFTALQVNGKWLITFNFVYGRLSARKQIERADEFLIAARDAQLRGHTAVSIDNLFNAAELLARVHLELHLVNGKSAKSHSATSSQINRWRSLGNVSAAFTNTFNKLSGARSAARYKAQANEELCVTVDDLDAVERELVLLRDRCRGLEVPELSDIAPHS